MASHKPLVNYRVAILATDGFEESELSEPLRALREAGAEAWIVSLKADPIQAFRHHDKTKKYDVDLILGEVKTEDFDALMLPGGALNADALRAEKSVQKFVRGFRLQSKPIAAICHAPWILISAEIIEGCEVTSYHTIKDDIVNAGGIWHDREVMQDNGHYVTSRKPADLPAFNQAMIEFFSEFKKAKKAAA